MAGTKGAVVRDALNAYEVITGPAGSVLTSQGEGFAPTFERPIGGGGGGGEIAQNSFLVSGGQVVWQTAYTFLVSAATYYIDGVLYTSPQATVTLDAADATDDRIDVIVVTSASIATHVTGVAAAQPSEPDIDPGTELKLAIVLVEAASSEPSNTSEVLFTEAAGSPGEWDWTTSGSGFNVTSSNQPRTGSKSIEGTTVAAGAYAQGEIGSGSLDPNLYSVLVIYIKSKATWSNNRGLTVSMRDQGVLVGSAVNITRTGTFGFVSSNTTDYQQVAIPITAFAVTSGLTIDQVRITDFGGSIGFYLDDLQFQGQAVAQQPIGITQTQADARYAPLGSAFAVIGSADATLPNERRLAAGTGVTLTDGGAGSTVTAALANMAQATIKGRADGAGTGAPGDLTPNQVSTILDGATDPFLRTSAAGGGSYTDEQAQDSVGAMVDASLVYVDATPLLTRAALTGDVTASQGSNATTIANDAVSNAKAANMADSTIKGRAVGAGTGDPADLDADDVSDILDTAADPFVRTSAAGGGGGGAAIIQLSPLSNEPMTSNPATPDVRNFHPTLDFDGSTDEEAVFTFVLMNGYAGGGLTVDTFWAFTSATSGNLRVQAAIERIDASSLDIDADSFASFNSAGGSAPGTSGQVITVTITFTSGAQMDSLAAGELGRLKIRRDADGTSGTDDIASDAELLFVTVRET